MIPVALPGGNFYPLLAVSLACLATLLTWIAVLCTTRSARWRVRMHPRKSLAAMGLLSLLGAIFPAQEGLRWIEVRRAERNEADHTLVLDTARTIQGIALPAGTQLRMRIPNQPDTFQSAIFPAPTTVAGARVTQLMRYMLAGAQPPQVTGVSAIIDGDQAVDGWRCARGHKVEFRPLNQGLQFASCHLAQGVDVAGQAIPAGTWVSLRSGNIAASNPQSAEGWLLRTDGSEAIIALGIPLLKADLRLDRQRNLLSFEGTLAKEYPLGPMTYPSGTRVATAAPTLAGAQQGDLIFSPSRGRSARRADGDDVAAGNSVLQGRDGTVRSVLQNRAAGVLDFASIGITP
jgi:hypothetical protein